MVNFARFLDVDAENALELTNKKFIYRFTQIEQRALASGKNINDMSLQEMDAIWNEIKQQQGWNFLHQITAAFPYVICW